MLSRTSFVAVVCGLGVGILVWPGAAPARGDRHETPVQPAAGQEVVNGSYQCSGTIYTDGQPANVSTWAYVSATSGITSDFYPIAQSSQNVPADLDVMAELCEDHVGQVVGQVPGICAIGPIRRERGQWGNGSGSTASFDFSCQGTRDQVIGVVGGFSRVALTVRLP